MIDPFCTFCTFGKSNIEVDAIFPRDSQVLQVYDTYIYSSLRETTMASTWMTIFQTYLPTHLPIYLSICIYLCVYKVHREILESLSKRRSCAAILPYKTNSTSTTSVWKSVGAFSLTFLWHFIPASSPCLFFPDPTDVSRWSTARPVEDPGDWPLRNNTAWNSPGALRFLRPWCRLSSPLRGRSLYSPILYLSLSLSLSSFSVYHLPLWAGNALGCREKFW